MSPLPSTSEPQTEFIRSMRTLRRRRWFLWGLIIAYLPAISLALELSGSDRITAMVFGVWILLVCVAVGLAAFAPCPRCGKPFHMHGFVPVYLRRCVHCELHVTAKGSDNV